MHLLLEGEQPGGGRGWVQVGRQQGVSARVGDQGVPGVQVLGRVLGRVRVGRVWVLHRGRQVWVELRVVLRVRVVLHVRVVEHVRVVIVVVLVVVRVAEYVGIGIVVAEYVVVGVIVVIIGKYVITRELIAILPDLRVVISIDIVVTRLLEYIAIALLRLLLEHIDTTVLLIVLLLGLARHLIAIHRLGHLLDDFLHRLVHNLVVYGLVSYSQHQ